MENLVERKQIGEEQLFSLFVRRTGYKHLRGVRRISERNLKAFGFRICS